MRGLWHASEIQETANGSGSGLSRQTRAHQQVLFTWLLEKYVSIHESQAAQRLRADQAQIAADEKKTLTIRSRISSSLVIYLIRR
jgi:hypothetical protein